MMTQTQIVQTLADSCEVTKKVAKSLLDTLAPERGSATGCRASQPLTAQRARK